jgi:1,4-dihydroxy-2-naphthoate octaprenyltransferase
VPTTLNGTAPGVSLRQACTVIPRVSKDAWRASSPFVRWLIASRAPVLVMTFSSAAVGGTLALLHGPIDAVAWSLCMIGLLLAHATNNQLNDFTDSALGIDRGNYFRNRYGAHVLEDGLMTRRQLLAYIAFTGGLATSIGAYLVLRIGAAVLWPLGFGAFFLLFYTYPLKRLGLGEIAVWLVWGPLMTAGSYLAATGRWSGWIALIGAVQALPTTTVIFGKHIDKIAFDTEKGVRTLPVRIGAARARHAVIAMLALPYVCVPLLAALGELPWATLVVFVALPDAIRAMRIHLAECPIACPSGYPATVWPLWYSAHAFAHARSFGLLLLAGLAIGWVIERGVIGSG